MCAIDRPVGNLHDVVVKHGHSQRFRAKALAFTGWAWAVTHKLGDTVTDIFRVCFPEAPFKVENNAFKAQLHGGFAFIASFHHHRYGFTARAKQDLVQLFLRNRTHRRVKVNRIPFCYRFNHLPVVPPLVSRTVPFQRSDGSFPHRSLGVRDDQVWIDFQLAPQPLAFGAGAMRCVKGKRARLNFRNADIMFRAGKVL